MLGLALAVLFGASGISQARDTDRETLVYKESETSTLGFRADLEVAGEQFTGQLVMVKESYLNGRTLTYSSHFESSLPDGIVIPEQERVTHSNDYVMSQVSGGSERDSESVRIHEYGTFETLASLAGMLAEGNDMPSSAEGKAFLSHALLMPEPAAISQYEVSAFENNKQVQFLMSNGLSIQYVLDERHNLNTLAVRNEELNLLYTVTSSEG
ncbi:hypothetical protein [Parendozoicomonas haliclonae]|nr:hypothetical protein [Parendozoicomonas haliclonae]